MLACLRLFKTVGNLRKPHVRVSLFTSSEWLWTRATYAVCNTTLHRHPDPPLKSQEGSCLGGGSIPPPDATPHHCTEHSWPLQPQSAPMSSYTTYPPPHGASKIRHWPKDYKVREKKTWYHFTVREMEVLCFPFLLLLWWKVKISRATPVHRTLNEFVFAFLSSWGNRMARTESN